MAQFTVNEWHLLCSIFYIFDTAGGWLLGVTSIGFLLHYSLWAWWNYRTWILAFPIDLLLHCLLPSELVTHPSVCNGEQLGTRACSCRSLSWPRYRRVASLLPRGGGSLRHAPLHAIASRPFTPRLIRHSTATRQTCSTREVCRVALRSRSSSRSWWSALCEVGQRRAYRNVESELTSDQTTARRARHGKMTG